jgi:hypothetical protein
MNGPPRHLNGAPGRLCGCERKQVPCGNDNKKGNYNINRKGKKGNCNINRKGNCNINRKGNCNINRKGKEDKCKSTARATAFMRRWVRPSFFRRCSRR